MNTRKLLIWGVAALALAVLVVAVTRPAMPGSGDITNEQLRKLTASGARLVDVRSQGEYALGHISGAENVPVETVTQAAASWDKSKPIVVYCATGARSLNAAQFLKAQGFTHVYNLANGIAAWDGQVTKDGGAAPAALKTNGKPVFIDFYSDT